MTIRLRTLTLLSALLVLSACPGEEATPPTDDDDDVGDGDTTDATDTGDECLGPDGCFSCPPTSSVELTNACTDASCEAFANTPERLPLLERDGTLPPLP